jgi:hypothetical protein
MTRDAESRLATRFCFSTLSSRFVLSSHRGGQKEISGKVAVFEAATPLFMGSFLNFNACPLPKAGLSQSRSQELTVFCRTSTKSSPGWIESMSMKTCFGPNVAFRRSQIRPAYANAVFTTVTDENPCHLKPLGNRLKDWPVRKPVLRGKQLIGSHTNRGQ